MSGSDNLSGVNQMNIVPPAVAATVRAVPADIKVVMRSAVIKIVGFFGVIEGLRRVDLVTLLTALGLGIAAIVCTDLLLTNLSSRAQSPRT
jgi:hypothetical protein